jgi:hypothetical protein
MKQPTSELRLKALERVRTFCAKPWKDHGDKAKSGPLVGWYTHDWNKMVRGIYTIYAGSGTELPIPDAKRIGDLIRKKYPNNNNWDNAVRVVGAHDVILNIIEKEFSFDSEP